jgi:hypothetical protein
MPDFAAAVTGRCQTINMPTSRIAVMNAQSFKVPSQLYFVDLP